MAEQPPGSGLGTGRRCLGIKVLCGPGKIGLLRRFQCGRNRDVALPCQHPPGERHTGGDTSCHGERLTPAHPVHQCAKDHRADHHPQYGGTGHQAVRQPLQTGRKPHRYRAGRPGVHRGGHPSQQAADQQQARQERQARQQPRQPGQGDQQARTDAHSQQRLPGAEAIDQQAARQHQQRVDHQVGGVDPPHLCLGQLPLADEQLGPHHRDTDPVEMHHGGLGHQQAQQAPTLAWGTFAV